MRLPWLQIDADGQTRARLLGRLLGIPETQGIGMTIALWTWALEMSPDGDFSGEVHGDAELVSAAVSWPEEDTQRLLRQLQRVGLLQLQPAIRVRGLDRYRPTWEKNRRKGHGKDKVLELHHTRAGSERDPRVSRRNPERKTETETENHVVAAPTQIWPAPPKPKRDRKPSAAEDFFGWLDATRATTKNLPPQHRPPAPRINKSFGDALLQVGRPELEGRYQAFLNDPANAAKDPPWPWEVFAATWSWRKAASLTPKSREVSSDPYADPMEAKNA